MKKVVYKCALFAKGNLNQKILLQKNRNRLRKMLVQQGMKAVRFWIFRKMGIKMKPAQVRRVLDFRKGQNMNAANQIRRLACQLAGGGRYAPLGFGPDSGLRSRKAGTDQNRGGEKIRIF